MSNPVHATFVDEMTDRFTAGLVEAMDAGTDTFSFEFSAKDWPEDKPLLIQVAGNVSPDEPMAVLVLIRPKSAVDQMTAVMTTQREEMLRQLEKQGKLRPKQVPAQPSAKGS